MCIISLLLVETTLSKFVQQNVVNIRTCAITFYDGHSKKRKSNEKNDFEKSVKPNCLEDKSNQIKQHNLQ